MTFSAPTRWGIAGAGLISSDFVPSIIRNLDRQEHQIVAVAARSLEKAEQFAVRFGISKSYGSYQDLAEDPEVDVVYVGTINTTHLKLCKLFLEAGKHVLCEKPLALNVQETQEILTLAKEKKLFLMEALWSRFLPAMKQMKHEILNGTIGEVRHARSTFGEVIDAPRVKKKELGGGTILDIGVYNIYFTQMAFEGEKPEKIIAQGVVNEDGVDEAANVILQYKGNRSATFTTSSKVSLSNEAEVFGTKGSLKLPCPFLAGAKLVTPNGVQEFPALRHSFFKEVDAEGLAHEAQHVRECLQKGLTESPVITHAETLLISEIMEEIMKQLGVSYTT